jgi:hypothetical protein
MIVPTIDSALEGFLRAELPLPEAVGDVSFDPPSGTWSAQLSRITVNLFLFGTGRSPLPPRPAQDRVIDGRIERRQPIPMVQLNYLVTAWAGTVRDEHQLIGDLLTLFMDNQQVPADKLPAELNSTVQIAVAHHDNSRAKDVWSTVGGAIKPSFELVVTTAGDAMPYIQLPPRVERVAAMVAPIPRPSG